MGGRNMNKGKQTRNELHRPPSADESFLRFNDFFTLSFILFHAFPGLHTVIL